MTQNVVIKSCTINEFDLVVSAWLLSEDDLSEEIDVIWEADNFDDVYRWCETNGYVVVE